VATCLDAHHAYGQLLLAHVVRHQLLAKLLPDAGKALSCQRICAAAGASLEPDNHPLIACRFHSLQGSHRERTRQYFPARKEQRATVNALGKCVITAAWSYCKQEEQNQRSQDEGIFSVSPRSGSDVPTKSTPASRHAARRSTAQGRRVSREVS